MIDQLKNSERLKIDDLTIFIDAEWNGDNIPVSVQLLLTDSKGFEGKYIVINESFAERLDNVLLNNWSGTYNCQVVFYPINDDMNVVHRILYDFYMTDDMKSHPGGFCFGGKVFMFYSFQDLSFAFGWNNISPQLFNEINSKSKMKVEQHRSLTGTLKIPDSNTYKLNNWKIRDLKGLTNTSLFEFASSLGIDMSNKNALDDYKSCMDRALLEKTVTFLNYGLDDVLVLRNIFQRFLELINSMLKESFQLPP